MTGWQTKNDSWMENRKKEWAIKEKILKYRLSDSALLKQFRKFYLTGKLTPKTRLALSDTLWMHPDQNEESWHELCKNATEEELEDICIFLVGESSQGYMGGIEGRLFNYICNNEYQDGIYNFKNEENCKNYGILIGFFIKWTRRANLWLKRPWDTEDCLCFHTIETWFSCLPYIPEDYFSTIYFDETDDRGDLTLQSLRSDIRLSHRMLHIIAWFVEPRGLQTDNTIIRQFVEKMRVALNDNELPQALKQLWAYIKSEEACYLKIIENNMTMNFQTTVMHQEAPLDNKEKFFKTVHHTFKDLGFTDPDFNLELIETVELNKHLSAKFISILGFAKGSSIPGYRYRVITTSKFVNNDKDRIDMDVILLTHPEGTEWQETSPVVLLVPRPDDNYDIAGSWHYQGHIYQLNYRLVRRTLAATHNFHFLRYEKFEYSEESRLNEEANPFFDVSYRPLKNGDKALLNTAKKDFPLLKPDEASPVKAEKKEPTKKKQLKDETGARKTGINTSGLRPLNDVKQGLLNASFDEFDEFWAMIELCEHSGIYISDDVKKDFKSPEVLTKRLQKSQYDFINVDSPKDLEDLTLLEKLFAVIPMRFYFEHYEALDACEEDEIINFYPDLFKTIAKMTMGEWKINSIRKKVIGSLDDIDCRINIKLKTQEKQFSFTYDAGGGEIDPKCLKDVVKLTDQLVSGRLLVDSESSDSIITMIYLPKPMAYFIEKII